MAGPLLGSRPSTGSAPAASRSRRLLDWLSGPSRSLICPDCGTANDAAIARWCGHCGQRLETLPADREQRSRSGLDPNQVRRVAGTAFIVLLILALIIPSALQGSGEVARGQSLRGDAARSGVVATSAPRPPREIAWSSDAVPVELGTTLLSSAGTAASVLAADRFEVLDLATGTVLRSVDLQATRIPYGFATVAGELLLLPGGDLDELVAQDLITGDVRWQIPLPASSPETAQDATLVDGDVVTTFANTVARLEGAAGLALWGRDLVADRRTGIHSLVDARSEGVTLVTVRPPGVELRRGATTATAGLANLSSTTGEIRWAVDLTPDEALDPMAVSATWLVHLDRSRGPNPVAVVRDARTGNEQVVLPVAGEVLDVALVGDLVLLSTTAAGVQAFEASSGAQRWNTPASPGPLVGVPDQERVVVPTQDGVKIVDAATGSMVGRVDIDGPASSTSVSSGVLTVATPDLSIRAYDLAGNQLWTRELPPPSIASIATDGTAVVVNSPAGIRVVDGRSGDRLTSVDRLDTDDARVEIPGSVAIDDGLVVASPLGGVVSGRGLAAIDGRTGLARWSRDGDQPPVFGSITGSDGLAWVSVGDEIHGYDLETGRRAFAALAGMPRGPLAVTRAVVVATPAGPECAGTESCPSAVIAVDRITRDLAWSSPAPACGPPAVANGRVLVPTSAGPWALGVADGGLLWRAPGPAACGPLALGPDHAHQAFGSQVHAWRLTDGEPAWQVDLGETIVTTPVIAGDDVVVGTVDGGLVALGATTGEIRWQFRLPSPALTDPVVVDGRWVVLLRDGRIVSLR